MKRRERSAKFRELQRKMRASHTKCHHCTALATELHHIIAVEDGGTDDESNLMPLCKDCHQEYTSDQTSERNRLWVQLTVKDDGEVLAQCKGEPSESLGNLGKVELKHEGEEPTRANKIHYEYEWIVTLEIPAYSEQESKEKLKKFRSELFDRYGMTDDVWLTRIRRYDGP